MTCILPNKENQLLLDKYAKIVGSQSAAYYLLASNNGYPLNLDPNGKPSKLYEDLLALCNGSEDNAILLKAYYYTPQYLKTNNWLEKSQKEPLFNGVLAVSFNNNVANNILQNDYFDLINESLDGSNNSNREYAARVAVERTRSEYIDQQEKLFRRYWRINPKQALKMANAAFFRKVILFFNSIFNNGAIKNPCKKHLKRVRETAYKEFNETLRYLIANELIDVIEHCELAGVTIPSFIDKQRLTEALKNKDYDYIYGLMSMLKESTAERRHVPNAQEVLRSITVLRPQSNLATTTILFNGFESTTDFILALQKPRSELTALQLQTIDNFYDEYKKALDDAKLFSQEAQSVHDSKIDDVVLMWFAQDPEVITLNRKIYDVIRNGITSRIISIQHSTNIHTNAEYKLKLRKLLVEKLDINNPNDAYNLYSSFLLWADEELAQVLKKLEKYINGSETMSAETLLYIRQDVLGYYKYILKQYLSSVSAEKNFLTQDLIDDILDAYNQRTRLVLETTDLLYKEALSKFASDAADQIVDEYVTVGDKESYKKTLKNALANLIDRGNIPAYEKLLGDGNKSKSIVVRAIQHVFNNDNREVRRQVEYRGSKLMRAYTKALGPLLRLGLSPFNAMKEIIETDGGLPTGYFLRQVNYGKFENERDEFKKKLLKKHRLVTEDGVNPSFDFGLEGEEERWMKYNDELDDWLELHCNRRYKAEYYKQRRRILGHDALEAMLEYLDLIQLLIEKCRDRETGFVYVNRLSPQELKRLNDLKDQLAELGNPYLVQVDASGKRVIYGYKTGDALDIAERIMAYNKWYSDNFKSTSDWDKYYEARDKIADQTQRLLFEEYNTMRTFSDGFYEELSMLSVPLEDEYYKLQARRSKLLRYTKEKRGYYTPNLICLGESVWKEIHDIEQKMANIKQKGDPDAAKVFENIAQMVPVTMTDPMNPQSKITVLDYYKRQALLAMATDPDAMKKFYNTFYKTVMIKGVPTLKPLDALYSLLPKKDEWIVYTTINQYGRQTGPLLNTEFDEKSNEQYQPKLKLYKNKNYDKIDPNSDSYIPELRAFYDEAIQMMKDALANLPYTTNMSPYTLPLRTARGGSIVSRYSARLRPDKGFVKAIKKHLVVNDTDSEIYREDLSLLPDGTPVNSINIRYIRKLEDPSTIDTDIVGSVTEFFEMAYNYKLKSKSVPMVENLIKFMEGDSAQTGSATQIERAKVALEMYGYGKMQLGLGDKNKKMSAWNAFATKMLNVILHVSQLALLAGKVHVAYKGFKAATWGVWTKAWLGRQYGFVDLIKSHWDLIKCMPLAIASIALTKNRTMVLAAMRYNGLTDLNEAFQGHDKNLFRRIAGKLAMAPFEIGDYSTTALIMMATYHQNRLIQNPWNGELKFMTQEEVVDMFLKHGKTEYEAIKYHDKASGNHLFKMYRLNKETGFFELKDKVTLKINGLRVTINPHNYVTKSIENRVSGGSQDTASITNGVVNKSGKAPLYQDPLLRLTVCLRGFLFSQGFDRIKYGNDYADFRYEASLYRDYGTDPMYRGQYNFETGHVEPGVYSSTWEAFKHLPLFLADASMSLITMRRMGAFGKSYKRKFSKQDMMSAKLFIGDLVGTVLFWSLSCAFTLFGVRQVPDDWWYQLEALTSVGASIELSSTTIPFETIGDLLQTVTTAKSYIDDVQLLIHTGAMLSGLTAQKPDEIIKQTSPYKNKPRWFKAYMRQILRPTGITGYYESFSPAINGLDDPDKVPSDVKLAKERVWGNEWDYLYSPEGLKDIYKAYTTPFGLQSSYDFYNGKVFPASLAPSRTKEGTIDKLINDVGVETPNTLETKSTSSNKSKNSRGSSRGPSRRSSRKSAR